MFDAPDVVKETFGTQSQYDDGGAYDNFKNEQNAYEQSLHSVEQEFQSAKGSAITEDDELDDYEKHIGVVTDAELLAQAKKARDTDIIEAIEHDEAYFQHLKEREARMGAPDLTRKEYDNIKNYHNMAKSEAYWPQDDDIADIQDDDIDEDDPIMKHYMSQPTDTGDPLVDEINMKLKQAAQSMQQDRTIYQMDDDTQDFLANYGSEHLDAYEQSSPKQRETLRKALDLKQSLEAKHSPFMSIPSVQDIKPIKKPMRHEPKLPLEDSSEYHEYKQRIKNKTPKFKVPKAQ